MTLKVKDGATWTPTAIENTADQKYASLNNLILENGNINVNEGVEIAIDKVSGTGILDNKGTVTLTSGALDGRSNNSGVINIDPGASASNVTFEKGELTPSKALIAVEAERTTLNGGMATGDDASASVAGVAMDADKNVKIEGVAFTGNTFTVDRNYPIIGAVTANLSDTQRLTITGSTFKNNTVTLNGTGSSGSSGGAAVSVKGQGKGSTLTITDSTFSGNQYNDTDNAANGAYGGAIGVQNASVTLTNVTLSGNSGDSGNQVQGGGYYQSIGSLNATQLKVSENKVETSSNLMGAGMVLWGTSGSISDSEFTGNTGEVDAWALGGGLYLRGSRWGGESDLSFSISDTTFSGNSLASKTDDAQGGGLYVKGDASNGTADGNGKISVQLDNVTFTDNTVSTASAGAASQGGALYILGVDDNGGSVPDNATVTVNNGTFTGNTAKGGRSQGGAIYNEGTLTVEGGSFTNNSAAAADGNEIAASNVGGAIYNADNAKLSINGTRFEGNTAAIAGAVNNQYDSSYITAITDAVFVNNTASLSAGGALRNQGIIDSIAGTTFEGNTAGNGGALWNGAGGTITSITDTTFTGNKSTNAVVGGGAITNAGVIKAINATTFTGNTAAGNGGAIYNVVSGGGQASIALSNTTFTDNTAGKLGGAIYNDGSLSFTGTNTFSGNTAAGAANDIYNAGSITVADGTTTLGSGLTQVGGSITIGANGTLDMASGSLLSFDATSGLTIDGGTFVADFGQLLTDYATTNTANGITDESIIGTSGNLNLRLDGGYYTLEQYNAAKGALLGQADVPEDATLNFLNANLQLDDDQALVVGATPDDNGNVTIKMAPVVVEGDQAPEDAALAGQEIPSVPNQIVSVVEANAPDKELLSADTITVSDSKFTAKGLQIDGTVKAEAVTLDVTAGSKVTLTGDEAGFTGVVNAEGDAVTTNVKVEGDAALTVGLEGNENAQNLVLNDVTVADGTFSVAGNGLDTTQVAANTLEVADASGTVIVDNASLTVENAVVENGLLSITDAVADLGTVKATGGVLFFDPSYGTIKSLANNELGSKLLVSDGSVVNVASGLDNLQELAQKAGFTTTADPATGGFILATGQSMLAVGQAIQLTPGGQIVVDAGVTYEETAPGSYVAKIDGNTIGDGAYFGQGSLLVVNGNTLNGATAAIDLSGATTKTLNVENGAKLLIADAVAGQKYTVISGATNADAATGNAFNSGTYNSDNSTGWKGDNLLTSSDMLTLTSTDGTVFMAKSEDAHTVFPGLSHELATAVNTLYGQKLNDVDADAMGVRFLSRATDNRFLGADKNAAASTIESAARIAFAGAVPQMTKMASDAGSNAVVNRLGFANPADGAQAMNAEGKIVDRNTTGFALWIAPLWQSQHGWGMEADNLDYGFNGNLGGVSLGADYTFENAIRAGITFNIGGGYAESSGGDLNSTENRMSFWGLGAYAGWNYENFGLMADISYTSTWNDLQQDMDSRMGMGDLEADVQASAISAGLRAEYKLETSVLDVIPHIGVRYMSLNTWGFDAESNGGTVLEGDGFHQDIWTFPVGVTFTKDFTLDSGWSFKPSIDFSVIPAAGDIKAKQDVAFTGLPGTYEVETQMMDYLTWQGGVGLELGNDTMSFGVNYTLQAGQHTTGHGVFGSFRYEF
ncbi:autotransporter domain-containing protein [Desulfovibrio piger]|uniref:autotransporter domain-containing protein n=1 Tax=Desulfovibrio piger TaxID=901 RepID=UPI0026F00CCF|nr:autotransporter domain-containing protein [Desulfovibrio piger]